MGAFCNSYGTTLCIIETANVRSAPGMSAMSFFGPLVFHLVLCVFCLQCKPNPIDDDL